MARVLAFRVVLVAALVACVIALVLAVSTLGRSGAGDDGDRSGPPSSASEASAVPPGAPAPAAIGPGDAAQRAIVIGVADAVSLDVRLPDGRDVVRIRALGIQGPGPCYAGESTAFARRVLNGKAVDLVTAGPAAASTPVDRFDRRLQRVVVDGRDYAVLAAEAGIARTYSVGADPTTMPPVRDAESRARTAGRGLWGPPCDGREG